MSSNQTDIQAYLNNLYSDISTSQISAEGRQKHNLSQDSCYVYGETVMNSLFSMVSDMAPKKGEVFYDLGSGGGKNLLFAALSFPFSKCVGVEYIDVLADTAKSKLTKLKQDLPTLNFEFPQTVDFVNTDFLKFDLSDADIIYTYSTCFSEDLMRGMAAVLSEQLKPGSRVITITKQLYSDKLRLIKSGSHAMEWGDATSYFYEKI